MSNADTTTLLPAKIQEQGLMPVQDLATFNLQLSKFQEIVKSYLQPGTDYGKIPGTDKDTLLKPGAEKLCEIYGFYADYHVEQQVENWDKSPELFDYTVKCTIKRRHDDKIMGAAIGSCNSYEAKYKWRKASRSCPDCGKDALAPSKKEWGGGFYCSTKKGGCNGSWKEFPTDRHRPSADEIAIVAKIKEQDTGKVPNDDIATQKNTVLKMAQKRALVSAAIASTRSSGIFSVDVEDFIDAEIKVSEIIREPIIDYGIIDTETGEVMHAQVQLDALDMLLPIAERSKFFKSWEDKGFTRAVIFKIITDNCEGVTHSNLDKKFTHRMRHKIDDILQERMESDNKEPA